ncbi:MAG: glycosyltransferase [Chloroflexota bacterium]|nr:glycosyltransferase [Chloroflexota bacterium]
MRYLFALASALIVYTWAGYPLLLKLLSSRKRYPTPSAPSQWPMVTVVTLAYNEEEEIRAKLENLIGLDYPRDCLQLLVASDGSTDATNDIVREYADRGIELYARSPNAGTTTTFNEAVALARGEIVVHSDVDTRYRPDYLRKIVPHYRDPRVGVVEGEFRFMNESSSGVAQNQALYWRFEMFLRRAESRIGILGTVSGALMSFRKAVYEPFLPHQSVDGSLPKLAIQKGYRVVHEPEALAYEVLVKSVRGEFRGRVRMTSRNLLGWGASEALLNVRKYPGISFALVSHKILRWLTPVFMITAFLSNLVLVCRWFYRVALLSQIGFYLCAVIGYALEGRGVRVRLFSAPFSFCLANLGFLVGMWKALTGQKTVTYRGGDQA